MFGVSGQVEELRALATERIAEAETRLQRAGGHRGAIRALSRLPRLLERPYRIAIAGEFNTGKSSLCNRLADIDSLPTAAIANTNAATRLYYADDIELHIVGRDGRSIAFKDESDLDRISDVGLFRFDVGLPSERLRQHELLDLPGLADPRFHRTPDDIVQHRIDMVIWCTPGTQAWKESERSEWSRLPERLRRNCILAVTHRDLVAQPSDEMMLVQRLKQETADDFVAIVPVSTRRGLPPGPNGEDQSGLETLWETVNEVMIDLRLERLARAALVTNRLLSEHLANGAGGATH